MRLLNWLNLSQVNRRTNLGPTNTLSRAKAKAILNHQIKQIPLLLLRMAQNQMKPKRLHVEIQTMRMCSSEEVMVMAMAMKCMHQTPLKKTKVQIQLHQDQDQQYLHLLLVLINHKLSQVDKIRPQMIIPKIKTNKRIM